MFLVHNSNHYYPSNHSSTFTRSKSFGSMLSFLLVKFFNTISESLCTTISDRFL